MCRNSRHLGSIGEDPGCRGCSGATENRNSRQRVMSCGDTGRSRCRERNFQSSGPGIAAGLHEFCPGGFVASAVFLLRGGAIPARQDAQPGAGNAGAARTVPAPWLGQSLSHAGRQSTAALGDILRDLRAGLRPDPRFSFRKQNVAAPLRSENSAAILPECAQ